MRNWMASSLSEADLRELVEWRRETHRHPELSGEEAGTARRVMEMLAPTSPDRVLTGLGGHGVAAVYESGVPGPALMVRSELDALPIEELGAVAHRSLVPGKSHLCGHDGHATILLGLARLLGRTRPTRGRVVLMFQPAEEDGSGAAAVIADARYDEIRADYAFALHNMPGLPLGEAFICEGPAHCASRGIRIQFHGSTAHAAHPENGRSPMRAVARLMPELEASGCGGPLRSGYSLVTVTHASMGAPAYGVAPGHAEIRATLRTVTDGEMDGLCSRIEELVRSAAADYGLGHDVDYADIFLACTNDAQAVDCFRAGSERAGVPCRPASEPQRASEDFGRFGHGAHSAMLLLGSGMDTPALHTPTYDFPDELIAPGVRLFAETLGVAMDRAG